jgi:hypothetical protein
MDKGGDGSNSVFNTITPLLAVEAVEHGMASDYCRIWLVKMVVLAVAVAEPPLEQMFQEQALGDTPPTSSISRQ